MKQVTTYVGIDAHKKDLFLAMLVGTKAAPVSWTAPNEPKAVKRLVRKLERAAPGPVRLCAPTAGHDLAYQVRRDRAGADSAQAW